MTDHQPSRRFIIGLLERHGLTNLMFEMEKSSCESPEMRAIRHRCIPRKPPVCSIICWSCSIRLRVRSGFPAPM